jgi:hypothetical protein
MAGPARRRPLARVALALVLASVAAVGLAPGAAPASVDALSRWTGGMDLYRSGVFTTQQTWLWCTAADVQIIRNIVDHGADHSRASQQRYFDYMRAHDRYWMPVSDGTEPSGWAAGLRRYVDSRYRMVASTGFDSALRSAVTNLRKTNLPVGLLVAHGDHAWVLTGFTATADPARTSHFTVTSVRVTGPLWGLQSRSYGYDMRPDTRLTPAQLQGFFTPWHYARIRMAWEGRWVSIQGIPGTASRATVTRTPAPPKATARPAAGAPSTASPRATVSARSAASPTATPPPTFVPTTAAPARAAGLVVPPDIQASIGPGRPVASSVAADSAITTGLGIAVAVAAVVLGLALAIARSRRVCARR